jgi:hypothetical protein
LRVQQWREGGVVRLAGALADGGPPVELEGILLRLGPEEKGAATQVVETEVLRANGQVERFLLEPARALPRRSALLQNFPNPFNPATTIPFVVGSNAAGERVQVRLEVFNLLGQKTATLVEGMLPAGLHRAEWDGRDGQGREAASGLYIYRLQAGDFSQSRRLLLVR